MALLLFAHITHAQIESGINDIVTIKLPKDRELKRLVRDSGLWSVIKKGTNRKLDKNWLTGNLYQSGYDADKHLELTLNTLTERYSTIPNKLGVAINEAILNITQHAYINSRLTRWWQYIYIKDNILHIIIFDKGVGIPANFKNRGLYTNLSDEAIIRKAMEKGVTSTNISGRGNGSSNIKKPVTKIEKDELLIMSKRGVYQYLNNTAIELSKLPVRLNGTLMSWKLKVTNDDSN